MYRDTERDSYVWRQFLYNCVDVKANIMDKYHRVLQRLSISISQTKVSFSKSATSKLILMTMIGTLISCPSELLPISIF